MGVSRSPLDLERKFQALGVAVKDLPKTQVREAALIVKASTLGFINPASGGDLRLSGVGKKGARVNVRFTLAGSTLEPTARVKATGPLQLIENDTKAGVRPRKRRSGRGSKRFVGPIQGYFHPGTKGKHPWFKGVEAARPPVAKLFQSQTSTLLRSIF